MRSCPLHGYDLLDAIPMCPKGISKQRAMASPRNRLGAHNGGPLGFGSLHQLAQAGGKLASLHVVGIATKAGVAPSGVWGVWTRTAQAAQVFHVQVADPSATKRRSDPVSIKLRIVAGTRNGAHIDESLHSVSLQ